MDNINMEGAYRLLEAMMADCGSVIRGGGVKDYLDAKETEMRARNSLLQALNTIERAKADQVTAIAKIKTERKFLNGERIVKPPICDSDAVIARLVLDTADGIDHGLYEYITEPKKRLHRHIYTRRNK